MNALIEMNQDQIAIEQLICELFPIDLQKAEIKFSNPLEIRKKIHDLEHYVMKVGQLTQIETTHEIANGHYVRKVFYPKGILAFGKIHKYPCFSFMPKGKVVVLTENGVKMVEGPYYEITRAGNKRVVFAIEDSERLTVHKTDKTNIDEIEKELIADDYSQVSNVHYDKFSGMTQEGLI